jgi:hypothetical protein
MNGACGPQRREKEMHKEFWWENRKKTDHLENLDSERGISLKWTCKKEDGME